VRIGLGNNGLVGSGAAARVVYPDQEWRKLDLLHISRLRSGLKK